MLVLCWAAGNRSIGLKTVKALCGQDMSPLMKQTFQEFVLNGGSK